MSIGSYKTLINQFNDKHKYVRASVVQDLKLESMQVGCIILKDSFKIKYMPSCNLPRTFEELKQFAAELNEIIKIVDDIRSGNP